MGNRLLDTYRTKLKKEYKFAFAATFVISLLVHLYKFTNTLPNHDSLYNFYSDQNVLGSGRWALSLACGFSSYYDLPWVNGLLSCIFIALTVVVIVALFEVENPVLIALIGALIAASPATTETLFFLFTADGYFIAMLLSALAVYYSRFDENRPHKWLISCLCICVSCGIYQAYVSFSLLLAVCYFAVQLLRNSYGKRACWQWVLRQGVIYAIALAGYYVIWKLCMYFSGTVVNDYQGIAEVGRISVNLLTGGLFRSIKSTVMYFLQWNILEYGLTLYSGLSILFLLLMCSGLLLAVCKSGIWKRKWAVLWLFLCIIAVVPFACIWHFTSDSIGYRPMMLQSLTVLFVLTAILYEEWAGALIKNAAALILAIIIFNNAIMANISYFYMNLTYERTYADGVEMMVQIHDLSDQYEFDQIAVIGNRAADMTWTALEAETGKTAPAGKIFMLSNLLETNLLMNRAQVLSYMKATFGLELEEVNGKKLAYLSELPEVAAMGCWPAGNSMAVIDGVLVVKLAEA